MGLLQNILGQKMHLSWVEDGKGGREIKPGWYLAIEFNYKNPPRKTRAEIEAETEAWLVELATMFEGIPAQSRYLSGPLGLFALTNDYPWPETYTELSMFAQKPILQAHVTAARAHNYYLMRRISGKFRPSSPMKYHFFHPATLEDAFGPKRQPRRNLELTRIDADGRMICQEFIPRNHIRICLHQDAGGRSCAPETNIPCIIRRSISKASLVISAARGCSSSTRDMRCSRKRKRSKRERPSIRKGIRRPFADWRLGWPGGPEGGPR